MARAILAGLKVLECAGYFAIALIISTAVSGVLLWATGALPLDGWTLDAVMTPLGTAMGYALITLAMASLAYPIACLIPNLRWFPAWVAVVILANIVTIVAGLNAYLAQTA